MTKPNSKQLLGLALAGVAIALMIGYFVSRSSSQSSKISYKKMRVERGDLNVTILSTGVVQPENRLEIKPPIAGRVEKILVNEGAVVKKGQILAWMSSTERAALLDAASAKGPAELQKWEEMYRPTPILAPIKGMIILRNMESGQTFTTQDAILVMSDRLTVKAQVDETDIAQIKLKQGASIILDAYPNQKLSAHVDQIAFDAKTVNNVTTYIVDVLPDETPPFMRSGMTANVTFDVASKSDALIVPADAIKIQEGKPYVMVSDSPTKRSSDLQEVQTGLTDGKRIEILSGLSEGTTILVPEFKLNKKSSSGSSPFSPMGRPKGH